MIVLIDNYDSFSYNLYQLIGSIRPNIPVIRVTSYPPLPFFAVSSMQKS